MKNRRWARGFGLAIGVATLLAAARSIAAPAVVIRENVAVHSAPNGGSPIVAHLEQDAAVTADDRTANRWRRVTLSSGVSGFVPDDTLRIEAPAPTPPTPASVTASNTSRRVLAARVNVFELPAHAAPNTTAPVLHVFMNGELLTVSPDAHDGWRSTRLPDGQTAYVSNAGLDFGGSPHESTSAPSGAPPPVQPIVTAPSVPSQAKLYVSDVGSLAALVVNDPVVNPMAQHLVSRRQGAIGAGVAIGIIGAAVLVAGILDTHPLCAGTFCSGSEPSAPLISVGALLLPVGGLVAALLYPKQDDLLDVINTWNLRHLDNQLTVEPIIVNQYYQ
jgi:hypothetical protein